MRNSPQSKTPFRSTMQVLPFTLLIIVNTFVSGACLLRWRIDEKWESTKDTPFKIRILKYPEMGDLLPGAYYVFQSAPIDSEKWKEIMIFRHDDAVSIPHDQVRFVNEKIGYIFMGWKYSVTVDGGVTWHTWDANQDLRGWQCCHYGLIKDVSIEEGGRGVMTLNSDAHLQGYAYLYTEDYGRHWGKGQ